MCFGFFCICYEDGFVKFRFYCSLDCIFGLNFSEFFFFGYLKCDMYQFEVYLKLCSYKFVYIFLIKGF